MEEDGYLMRTVKLNLRFGGVAALSNVSIDVHKSEILAVIGPNGAGKSCLLNCLNGFYRPQEGKVLLREMDITHLSSHGIAALGVARTFQGMQLFPGLSVIDNILTGRHVHMKTGAIKGFFYRPWTHREELQERKKVEEIIDFLEIKQIRHKLVGSLGYGLRKRVDLGRAIAMDPAILLIDELMAGMNLEEKGDIARFVIDIREARDIPIVMVEHDMQVVMDISDRIYVLDWGNVIAEGAPGAIKKDPVVIKAYLGEVIKMADMSEARRNWGGFVDIIEQGIETLPQLLAYQANRFGEKTFYRKKDFGIWQCYTWNDVLDQVKTLAMGMLSLGVERGQTVAMVGENRPELFWSEYAAQALGAKAVCLYPDLTPPQMEFILTHSESVIIICEDQEQVDKILEIDGKLPELHTIIYWDDRGMWKYRHPKLITLNQVQEKGKVYLKKHPDRFEKEVAVGKGSDISTLSYTSGTTGLPKGCIMSNTNIFDSAFRVAGSVFVKPFSQYLSYISPAWATEQLFGLTLGLLVPLTVNFPEEPETVQENIREIGAEILTLSPRQWESIASLVEARIMDAGPISRTCYKSGMTVGRKVNLALLQGEKVPFKWRFLYPLADRLLLKHLRDNTGLQATYLALSGGSGMAPDVFRFFHAMGVKLRNAFGTTEIGMLSQHQGETFDLETVGKWYPVLPQFGPPLEWKLTDEGELLVRGGSGFSGYYKNPEATAERLVNGWYKTGDAVNLTEKNELVYLDRVSDMRQLSTGHRYPPQFIESMIRFSPFIKDAMTLGDEGKLFVAAFINIDATTLGRWAEQKRIGYTTFTDLSQNQKIRELIKTEIEKVNYFLPEGSRVKRFINLPKELDPDEDELTRTRKLRRKFLEQKYNSFVLATYMGDKEFQAEVPVKYQDGRAGIVRATVYINDLPV